MTAFTHGNPSRAPEQRWRRTIDRRGRPTRLTVRRLLRDFGFAGLGPESQATIESRLADVGVTVDPPLSRADASTIITLDAAEGAPAAPIPATAGESAGGPAPAPPAAPSPAAVEPTPPARPAGQPGADRVTQSALRAAKGAAQRLAELENALYRERAEKEAAQKRVEELEAQVRRVEELETEVRRLSELEAEVRRLEPVPDQGNDRPEEPTPEAPLAVAPPQPDIEFGGQAPTPAPGRSGRSVGPLKVSRRKSEAGSESKRRRLSRRQREIACVSCGRKDEAGSPREAEAMGWIVMGNKALCPTCTEEGWRLTPRTRLPYRLTAPELEG